MEMVGADLAAGRETAPVVKSGADSPLHGLDYLFVFQLDDVKIGTDSLIAQ